MNNIHPNEMILQRYALGELDDIMLMLLSAHLSFCGQCQEKLQHIESFQAQKHLTQMASLLNQVAPFSDLDSMIDSITSLPITGIIKQSKPSYMKWECHQLPVPHVLSPLVKNCQKWHMERRRLWRSPVTFHDPNYQISFKFMEDGCNLPSYLYQGELNLILNGALLTKRQTFKQGDMICLQDKAKLSSAKEQGCLFVSISNSHLNQLFESNS
jgi:putative transcriptional regulator